jgi:hypothetical protein
MCMGTPPLAPALLLLLLLLLVQLAVAALRG